MNEKILITELADHQRDALLGGESVLHNGRVLSRSDVETKDEHEARLKSEKAAAEEAARSVEDGVAAQLAKGDLVSKSELDGLRKQVEELSAQVAALKGGGDPRPAVPVDEARKAELDAMSVNDLRKLAKDSGATLDGNSKDEVVSAILAHEATKAQNGSAQGNP